MSSKGSWSYDAELSQDEEEDRQLEGRAEGEYHGDAEMDETLRGDHRLDGPALVAEKEAYARRQHDEVTEDAPQVKEENEKDHEEGAVEQPALSASRNSRQTR